MAAPRKIAPSRRTGRAEAGAGRCTCLIRMFTAVARAVVAAAGLRTAVSTGEATAVATVQGVVGDAVGATTTPAASVDFRNEWRRERRSDSRPYGRDRRPHSEKEPRRATQWMGWVRLVRSDLQ